MNKIKNQCGEYQNRNVEFIVMKDGIEMLL